ncbi:MAG: hypothetical protein ACT4OJ_00350 [Bacteroidota bacterium]
MAAKIRFTCKLACITPVWQEGMDETDFLGLVSLHHSEYIRLLHFIGLQFIKQVLGFIIKK